MGAVGDVQGGGTATEVGNQHMLRIAASSGEVGGAHKRCTLLGDDGRRQFVFRLGAKVVGVGDNGHRLGRLTHQESLLEAKQVEEKVETAREERRPRPQARKLLRATTDGRRRRALVSIVDLKGYEAKRSSNDGTYRIRCTICEDSRRRLAGKRGTYRMGKFRGQRIVEHAPEQVPVLGAKKSLRVWGAANHARAPRGEREDAGVIGDDKGAVAPLRRIRRGHREGTACRSSEGPEGG